MAFFDFFSLRIRFIIISFCYIKKFKGLQIRDQKQHTPPQTKKKKRFLRENIIFQKLKLLLIFKQKKTNFLLIF